MKKHLFWVIYILGLFIFTSCQKDPDPTPVPPDPVPTRTVLVYMAAENSLSSFTTNNINGMIQGMKSTGDNLIVYLDTPSAPPRLIRITPAGQTILRTYEEENSASPEVLRRVIAETKELFLTESYGLVLWSHGLGWIPADVQAKSARSYVPYMEYQGDTPDFLMTKWFGEDTGAGSKMSIDQLVSALPADRSLDFLIFDACLMSNVESLYPLRNAARYIVASPGEIMGAGFPYKTVTPLCFAEPFSPAAVAEAFMVFYRAESYNYGGETFNSGAMTAVNTSELEALAGSVRAIMESNPAPLDDVSAVQNFDNYFSPVFFDLEDYASRLTGSSGTLYTNFIAQLKKTVIYADSTPKLYGNTGGSKLYSVTHNCGLTAFIPNTNAPLNAAFKQTAWAVATAQN